MTESLSPAESPAPKETPLRRWLAWAWVGGTIGLWVVAAMDVALRDRVPGLAAVFYASPPIVLGVLLLVMAGLGWRWRSWSKSIRVKQIDVCESSMSRRALAPVKPDASAFRLICSATAILGCVCVGVWLFGNFRGPSARKTPPDALKIVFWNVGRGQFASWDQIAEELSRFEADVLALAEVNAEEVQTREFWQTRLPVYSPLPLHSGLVLLVKGEATQQAAGQLAKAGRFRRVAVTLRGVRFDMILADIISDPLQPRQPPLGKLFEIMQAQADTPTLVVGDFNTPPTSVCFDAWRADWSRAWDDAGSGYQATWPQPLPVLTLDHVWGNRGLTFHRCVCGWSSCSDHRPVIVELTVH
jgi:endonuclease/exonuclease/phosphatase (EEP) superfamily protein YafD